MSSAGSALPPYINGRFQDIQRPQETFPCANPAKPSDLLAIMNWSKDLVDEVVVGMKRAQAEFQELSLAERVALVDRVIRSLRDTAEEIKSQMMLELARSRFAVEEEWRLCESLFELLPRYCAEAMEEKKNTHSWTWTTAPVGLVLVSSTVALPVYTILSSLLPALVAGNAVTVKPSSHCPLSSSLIASCLHQAQLPSGLVQVVYGGFEVYRSLLLTHQYDVVFYTGGEETREQIRKDLFNYQNTRIVLCTGGKNAAIILESANIDGAVDRCLYGACADTGQRVEATGLAFVQEKCLEEFVEKFVRSVKALPIGAREDLSDASRHVMGPLCSADARERFLRFQGIAYRESFETLRWGKSIDNPGNGYFVSPGVHFMRPEKVCKSVYASSPSFGPDLAIVPVSGWEEAVGIIDVMNTAHVVSVHTDSENEVREIRKCSRVPFLYWNRATTDLDPELPALSRGRPDHIIASGLGFLNATLFHKTLVTTMAKQGSTLFAMLAFLAASLFATSISPLSARAADYQTSVEGNDVVKGKFYPKARRFQLMPLQGGSIINQSFIDTFFYSASIGYNINEWHAINVEAFIGFSQDRGERDCVENFYFNEERAERQQAQDGLPSAKCDPNNTTNAAQRSDPNEPMPSNVRGSDAWEKERNARGPYHRKPAYMPIRQIDQLYGLNYQWTPVYGKALWFMSFVGYLDFYTSVSLGVARSTFWPRKDTVPCTDDPSKTCDTKSDGTSNPNLFGKAGRPDPIKQTSPTLGVGLGSRFFLGRQISKSKNEPSLEFVGNVELRNFTVFGSDPNNDNAWMNFFALWGGVGVML